MKDFSKIRFKNVNEVNEFFRNNDQLCLEYLEWVRWNGQPRCGICGIEANCGWIENKGMYKCYSCRKFFTVTTDSLFSSYKMGILPKWMRLLGMFGRIDLGSEDICGILGVQQRTAYIMQMKMRYAMLRFQSRQKLKGIVEVDETYYGPVPMKDLRLKEAKEKYDKWRDEVERKTGERPRGIDNKHMVLGMHERGGRSLYFIIDVQNFIRPKDVILDLLYTHIEKDSIVMTDKSNYYTGIEKYFQLHKIIIHNESSDKKTAEKETKQQPNEMYVDDSNTNDLIENSSELKEPKYVRWERYEYNGKTKNLMITTNAIESRWNQLKNNFIKRHACLTDEHLASYLSEAAWRVKKFSTRETFHDIFLFVLNLACERKVPYKKIKKLGRKKIGKTTSKKRKGKIKYARIRGQELKKQKEALLANKKNEI